MSSLKCTKKVVEAMGYEWKDWYCEKAIMPKRLVDDIRFWHSEGESHFEEVPVSQIVGQEHGRFELSQSEPRWIELLHSMDEKEWKNKNSWEIYNVIVEQSFGSRPVSLYKYDNSYFIAEGIHRSVFAKFLEMETMRCEVTDYVFDDLSYSYYQRLCKLVGEEAFKQDDKLTQIHQVELPWHDYLFIVGWDDASISALEHQFAKARSIMTSFFKRKFFEWKYRMQTNRCHCFRFVSADNSAMPDIRATLVHVLSELR